DAKYDIIFDIDTSRLVVEIDSAPSKAGANNIDFACLVDDPGISHVVHQIVQDPIASSAPGSSPAVNQADVVIEGAAVGSDALDHVPNVIVLCDSVGSAGLEVLRGTSQETNRNAGVITVGHIVVGIGNVVSVALRYPLASRKNAGVSLHDVVVDKNVLHNIIGIVAAVGVMTNVNAGAANIVEGRVLNDVFEGVRSSGARGSDLKT